VTARPTSPHPPAPTPAGSFAAGFSSLGAGEQDRDVPALPVRGTLPGWLRGDLLRNGPALFDTPRRSVRHWFDGQAVLHRFAVADGAVSYRSRLLDTPASRAVRDEGRIAFAEFATDPCASLFGRFFTRWRREPTPNACVNIARVGDRTFALTETPVPVEFDPETLATVGVASHPDGLGGATTTAHPLPDPGTGDLLNVVLAFGRRSEYRVTRQRGDLARELVATVPADRPGYLHSFAVTERYVVLVIGPLVVDPLSFVLRGRPFIDNFRWSPERGTRIVVVETAGGAVRVDTTTAPLFAFHHVGASEDAGTVVVDLCAYPDAGIVDGLRLDRLRAARPTPMPRLLRLRVPLDGGPSGNVTVTSRQLSVEPLELPRTAVRPGRPYRYAFGCGAADAGGTNFLDQLVKVDVHAGTAVAWREPGCHPGEPVVVPRPAAAGGTGAEDDGVALSVVLDSRAGSSFLLVLDAGTLTELARAAVPHAIPLGFHGGFSAR
jgi:beta,beta-carotene 9',10'-dioxygenase